MTGSQLLQRSLSRRDVLKGTAAAGAGAAMFSVAPGVWRNRVGAQDSDFSGTTVTWMTNQRHDMVIKARLFEEFAEETGINVDFQVFADEYDDQLKLAFESGNPPDIFNLIGSPREQVEAGWSQPLDDYIHGTPGLEESFLPGAWVPNRGIWNGEMHGLPMYAQTMRLYYNRTIFENAGLDPNQPPTTFTEMREMSNQITDALSGDGVYGFILGDQFTWVWWMNGECMAQGTGFYKFNWATGEYQWNHDGLKEAMQLMVDMKQDGSIFPGIHTMTDDDARQQFSLGRAGMIIGGSWNPGVFNDQFESTEDWETAYLPEPDSGMQGRHQQGIGDYYTIAATSEVQDAAWEVLKFMYSIETMTTLYEEGMGVMGVSAANTGESDVRGVPLLAPTERDLIIPPEPGLPTITPDGPTVLQEIWDDDGETMDDLLAAVNESYNETFQRVIDDGTLNLDDFVIPDFDPLTWNPAE